MSKNGCVHLRSALMSGVTRAIGAAEIEIVFRRDKSDHALGHPGKDDADLLFRGLIRQRAVKILPQAVDEVRHLIA